MTHTYTFVKVDRSTRDTVQLSGDLVKVERKKHEPWEAFYLSDGHYRITTSEGQIDVAAPIWIVFDSKGFPYPVAPKVFDEIWEVVKV